MIDRELTAFCGTYCGICAWKEKIGCKGCRANRGDMFWGVCDKATCCIEKGLAHCGQCADMPCEKLRALFDDPEHGDTGARLRNLQNWRDGNDTCEALQNPAQEQANRL